MSTENIIMPVQEEAEERDTNVLAHAPVPEEVEEKIIHLDDITASDIFEGVLKKTEDGDTACMIMCTLEKYKLMEDKEKGEFFANRKTISTQTPEPEFTDIDIYALSDDVWIVSLMFDSKEDAYLVDIMDQLNQHKNMIMNIRRRMAENDNYTPEYIPRYLLTLAPYDFGGLASLTFIDPLDYFNAEDFENKKYGVHILFATDNMTFERADATEEEIVDMQAEIEREEEEKRNMTFRSSF